jgi:integrase
VTAAGLPAIRFHDMRHTAATILLTKGIHHKLVSDMLGHASAMLTLDTYSHVIPAMHADAAAAMDAVFTA